MISRSSRGEVARGGGREVEWISRGGGIAIILEQREV